MARPRGSGWMADVLVNNQRVRRQFATQKEAEAFEKNAYQELNTVNHANAIGKLWKRWSRDMYFNTPNEKNALRITDELIQRLGPHTQVSDVSSKVIAALVDDLRAKGNVNNTVNTKMSILSRLLNRAKQEDAIRELPYVPFFKPNEGRVRALTVEEEDAIVSRLPDASRAFATFLLYTGCRPSEARRILWKDVSDDAVTFWKTKTNKPRTVPLTTPAKEALAYARSQGWPTPWGSIVYQTFMLHWRKAKTEVGLADDKQATPYVTRHTCATRLGKAKVDPIRMAEWLGHARLDQTRKYTHLDVEDLLVGADALEQFSLRRSDTPSDSVNVTAKRLKPS